MRRKKGGEKGVGGKGVERSRKKLRERRREGIRGELMDQRGNVT